MPRPLYDPKVLTHSSTDEDLKWVTAAAGLLLLFVAVIGSVVSALL